MKHKKVSDKEYAKAVRKGSRELEIELHGKQVSMSGKKIHRSPKDYKREKYKNYEDTEEDD